MNTAGTVFLVLFLLLLFGAIGWIIFARWRAERLGLPPPSFSSFIPFYTSRPSYGVQPAPSGIAGWFQDRIRGFKASNSRTAAGAYEGTGGIAGGRTRAAGSGPLDPDDAWDTRVGAEADAYYFNEGRDLGTSGGGAHSYDASQRGGQSRGHDDTAYLGGGALGGSSYNMNLPTDLAAADGSHEEQRGRSRGRSPQVTNASTKSLSNPFDDSADPSNISLRGISPRPMLDADAAGHGEGRGAADSHSERRSVFHENV